MKLFTIGDSVSQGFMSGAAAKTNLAYSTLIAKAMGIAGYSIPEWPANGLPADIEAILRRLNRRYGTDIKGIEWLTIFQTLNDVLDQSEDYYEREAGSEEKPYRNGVEFFNNVAAWGFKVADAWQVTPAICRRYIRDASSFFEDGYLAGPNEAFYRTALKVLNPSLKNTYDGYSQLDWLHHHAANNHDGGVENVCLWLGANNALGTVLHLKINQTLNTPAQRPHTLSYDERERAGWNLWHPDDFRADYEQLMQRIDNIMRNNSAPNWKVFIGTVPLVTIAPIAKGVGAETNVPARGKYYKYYTYFPFEEEFARKTGIHLTMSDAMHIDACIMEFNNIIKGLIASYNSCHNGIQRYHVVDIANSLNQMAWKRNDGCPTYQFPPDFDFMYPKVNTKYYHADRSGALKEGGIFSLDGVHPTAIGQGIIAWEFMKEMAAAGIVFNNALDWQAIKASDTLYSHPISLMHEIYGFDKLGEHIVKLVQLFKD